MHNIRGESSGESTSDLNEEESDSNVGICWVSSCILAYDHTAWNFLKWVLQKVGFGKKGRRWVRVCIANAWFSIE